MNMPRFKNHKIKKPAERIAGNKKTVYELSVIVTRYAEDDATAIACLSSLRKQTVAKLEVLFLDQKNSEKIQRVCAKLNTRSKK